MAKSLLPQSATILLKRMKQKYSLNRFPRRVVDRSFHGVPLKVQIADVIAEDWYDHDWTELPEVTLLSQHQLKKGATVFNCGAHQGIVALVLARLVGQNGRVIAFEAHPHNVEIARANQQLNQIKQLEIQHVAIVEKRGPVKFNMELNASISSRGFSVDGTTIDDLTKQYGAPQVVFMDIEGQECRALTSAKATLAGKADWFVEAHVGCGLEEAGDSVDALLSFFPESRFSRYFAFDGKGRAFSPDADIERLRKERFWLIAINKR